MRIWLLVEIVRLGLHLRNEVAPHDRDRHGPVRIEIDLDDLGVDVGRRPVRLAGDGGVARTATPPSIASIRAAGMLQTTKRLPRLPLRLRSRTRLVRSCASRTAAGTFIALQRLLAHDAVDQKAMAGLEAADAGLDVGIEDVGDAGVGVEIAGHHQALAQRRHRRMAAAEPQAVGLR